MTSWMQPQEGAKESSAKDSPNMIKQKKRWEFGCFKPLTIRVTCYTPIANQLLDLFLTGRMTESELALLPNGIVTLLALGTSSSSLQATSRKILGFFAQASSASWSTPQDQGCRLLCLTHLVMFLPLRSGSEALQKKIKRYAWEGLDRKSKYPSPGLHVSWLTSELLLWNSLVTLMLHNRMAMCTNYFIRYLCNLPFLLEKLTSLLAFQDF